MFRHKPLQLCLYSELLGDLQGYIPENMYVIKPGIDFPTEKYRFPEFESYYRTVKERFQQVILAEPKETYPLPVAKCDTCRWWKDCYKKWHVDDHLSLIAGIRSNQTKELDQQAGLEAGLSILMAAQSGANLIHDVGYLEKVAGHEAISVEYAKRFLEDINYPEDKISKIVSCISNGKVILEYLVHQI